MKTVKALIGVVVVVLSLTTLAACTGSKYVAKPNEELFGTWQNEALGQQKVTIASDGYRIYSRATDLDPLYKGTLVITAKWKDSKGSLWYRTYQAATGGTGSPMNTKSQVLYRVGSSGAVLEAIGAPVSEFSPSAFPAKLDVTSSSYGQYSRKAAFPHGVLYGDSWGE